MSDERSGEDAVLPPRDEQTPDMFEPQEQEPGLAIYAELATDESELTIVGGWSLPPDNQIPPKLYVEAPGGWTYIFVVQSRYKG